MSSLFIASRSIPHDGDRRVLAVGRTRGGSALLQVTARAGDLREDRDAGAGQSSSEGEGIVKRQLAIWSWRIQDRAAPRRPKWLHMLICPFCRGAVRRFRRAERRAEAS